MVDPAVVSIAHMIYVRAMKDADAILAKYLGPLHPARVALEPLSTREWIERKAEAGEL